jgi:hypothetical protein
MYNVFGIHSGSTPQGKNSRTNSYYYYFYICPLVLLFKIGSLYGMVQSNIVQNNLNYNYFNASFMVFNKTHHTISIQAYVVQNQNV